MVIKNIQNYVVYDYETTGLDILTARIVSAGYIKVVENKIVDEMSFVVKQPVKIPDECIAIHGITNERMNKEGIDPKVAMQRGSDFMKKNWCLGLNNLGYDYFLAEQECNRFGLERPRVENQIDVGLLYKGMAIGNIYNEKEFFYKYAWRVREIRAKGVKFNLNFLTKHFGCENLREGGIHTVLHDIKMTHNIFQKMKEAHYAN